MSHLKNLEVIFVKFVCYLIDSSDGNIFKYLITLWWGSSDGRAVKLCDEEESDLDVGVARL